MRARRTVWAAGVAVLILLVGGAVLIISNVAPSHQGAPARQGPGDVVCDIIRNEVGRQLREAGASYDDLQVTVAVHRDNGTPFKVTYRGLQNLKAPDGTTPAGNGDFIMEYIGAGQWQGSLGGKQFTVLAGSRDNLDLPFVNDPQVIGQWESVDFVASPADFNPDKQSWKDGLYFTGLTFLEGGKTRQPWFTWTKGVVMHHGDMTASHYEIREFNGKPYMFFEWKSGDVTLLGMKPHYYVLKKKV
jgi:bla regulator protein BlaR1